MPTAYVLCLGVVTYCSSTVTLSGLNEQSREVLSTACQERCMLDKETATALGLTGGVVSLSAL